VPSCSSPASTETGVPTCAGSIFPQHRVTAPVGSSAVRCVCRYWRLLPSHRAIRGACRPGEDRWPNSFRALGVRAGPANFLADGPAPSCLVRVGPFLGGDFPARNLTVCLDRSGLLREEIDHRVLMIFPSPAAKKTHGAMVDRRARGVCGEEARGGCVRFLRRLATWIGSGTARHSTATKPSH
jgi:hypothetical protein